MTAVKPTQSVITELRLMPPEHRIGYARQVLERLQAMNQLDLDEVGRLLCHASSESMRTQFPISGDLRLTKQEEFEIGIFGSADGNPAEGSGKLRHTSSEGESDE